MEKLSFYQKFSTNSRVNTLLIKRLVTVERKNVTLVENSEKSSKKNQNFGFPYGKVENLMWKKMLKTPKMNFERKNEFLRKKKGKIERDFHNPPTKNRGLFHGEGCFQKTWKSRHYKGFSGFPQNPQGILLRLRQIIYLFSLFLFCDQSGRDVCVFANIAVPNLPPSTNIGEQMG